MALARSDLAADAGIPRAGILVSHVARWEGFPGPRFCGLGGKFLGP